jgi:mannosyltransferase
MAIARPVRVLLFAAAVLWCFFLYQVFRPSSGLRGPGERYVNFERDPNLDRPYFTLPFNQKASAI